MEAAISCLDDDETERWYDFEIIANDLATDDEQLH